MNIEQDFETLRGSIAFHPELVAALSRIEEAAAAWKNDASLATKLGAEVERLRAAAKTLLNTAHIEAFDHATTQLIVLDDVLREFRRALEEEK